MANFRPLQPAPLDQDQPAQKQQNKPLLTQKPKRTVTLGACVACRRRKSKCDGSRPTCTCCAQKETECVYELGPHEKPSQAMKRKNEEMQGELSNLRQLYDFLRLKPEHEAFEILRQIRETPPDTCVSQRIKELADSVRQGDISTPASRQSPSVNSPEPSFCLPPLSMALESLAQDTPGYASSPRFPRSILNDESQDPMSQRRKHTPGADVSTRPGLQSSEPRTSSDSIHQAPSSSASCSADSRFRSAVNWTGVTDDAELVERLMSQWYKWEYTYYHFLHWELFLEDMAHGRPALCSKLLVNAILAHASFHLSSVKDRAKPFAENLITSFYTEALRHWDEEKGTEDLTKIQACMLLYLILGKVGRDKVGHFYLEEACRLGERCWGRSGGYGYDLPTPETLSDDQWMAALGVTAWSTFNFQLLMASTYRFPPIVTDSPRFPLYCEYSTGKIPFEPLFESECHRAMIMLKVVKALGDWATEDSGVAPNPILAEALYLRLQAWGDKWLPLLDPHKSPLPEYLLSAMTFHCSIILLVQPFLGRNSPIEPPTPCHHRAQSIISASLRELRHLITLHDRYHGWDNAIPFVLHSISITGFGSLDEISTLNPTPTHLALEASEPYFGLLTCIRALRDISKFIYYAQPLFRLLTQASQAMDVRLPDEIMQAFKEYTSEEWTKFASCMVSSQYVADMRNAVTDLEKRRMDDIIAQWGALTLREKENEDEIPRKSEDVPFRTSKAPPMT